MSNNLNYQSGDWNIHCDVCGRKIKASESKQRWDGFRVCADDWEMRHPQDFLRTKPEVISVPFTRKQPDVFVGAYTATEHTWNGEALDLMEMN